VKRREFIVAMGGAAVWPISAPAQQIAQPCRIGILIPFDDNEPQVKARLSAFKQRLHEPGWIEGRNIRLDYRFTGQDAEHIRTGTEELIALGPDVIVAWSNPIVAIVQKATHWPRVPFKSSVSPILCAGVSKSLVKAFSLHWFLAEPIPPTGTCSPVVS
jgi:putative tryptophan/tyrosine transport system substrate-binding protein